MDFPVPFQMRFLSGLRFSQMFTVCVRASITIRERVPKSANLGAYFEHYAFILAFSNGAPRNVTRASYFHKRPSKTVLSDTLLALIELISDK